MFSTSLVFAKSDFIDVSTNCSVSPIVPYAAKVQFYAEGELSPASQVETALFSYTTYVNGRVIDSKNIQENDYEDDFSYSDTYTGEILDTVKIASTTAGIDIYGDFENDKDEDEYFITD
ncbi:hypothetical protein [Wukongibacter sp. M2B1]|uniref:hypothetical protein n=1 Tax=Wukongibacter sp. M2B1 TaxID=3088895 RepID=UPI003D7A79AE